MPAIDALGLCRRGVVTLQVLIVLGIVLLLHASAVSAYATENATQISIDHAHLFFSPFNWRKDGDIYAQTNNPGAYLRCRFTGSSIRLKVDVSMLSGVASGSYPEIAYQINQGPVTRRILNASDESITLAVGLDAKQIHAVTVWFRSSQAIDRWVTPVNVIRVTGLELDPGHDLVAPMLRPARGLIYSDSNGIGWAINSAGGSHNAADATKAWTALLGSLLDAEIGNVSFSAQGWDRIGTNNVPRFYGTTDPQRAWNLYSAGQSRLVDGLLDPQPDWILINQGTNDGFNGVPEGTIQSRFQSWMAAVRLAAPDAHIIVMVPPHGYARAPLTSGFDTVADANSTLIDFGLDFDELIQSPAYSHDGGLHHNTAGHILIAELIFKLLNGSRGKMWTGDGGDLSWHNPLNWNPVGEPGIADDVIIDAPGSEIFFSAGSSVINSLICNADMHLTGGELQISEEASLTALTLTDGSLGGSGNIVISDSFVWSEGTIGGTGTATLLHGAVGTLDSLPKTLGRDFVNQGELNLDGDAQIVAVGEKLNVLANHGILNKIGAGIGSIGVTLGNEGAVNVLGGTLNLYEVTQLKGHLLDGGDWTVAANASLAFPTTVHVLGGDARVTLIGSGAEFAAISSLREINDGASLEMAGASQLTISPKGQPLTNEGVITIDSISQLIINGGYAQGMSGLLNTTIDAKADVVALIAGGDVVLGGSLVLGFVGGQAPPLGVSVTVLTCGGSVISQFTSLAHPLDHPCLIDLIYGEDDVRFGLETSPPFALCKTDIVVQLDSTGYAELSILDIDNGSFDNCQIKSIVVTPSVFTCQDLGMHVVTMTVTDAAGNVSFCETEVFVKQTTLYQGVSDGSWFDDENWCGGIPTAKSPVSLDRAVIVDSLGAQAASLDVLAGGELIIAGDADASLTAGGITVRQDGVISLLAGGTLMATTVTIEAGGTLNMTHPTATLVVDELVIHEGGSLNWQAGLIQLHGTWVNDVVINVGCNDMFAALVLDDGLVVAPQVIICANGQLLGDGVIAAPVENNGLVSPGFDFSGRLAIDGDFTQLKTGELLVKIGGLQPGVKFDEVAVSGQAGIGGSLHVELVNEFEPAWADTFTILAAETVLGSFNQTQLPEIGLLLRFAVVQEMNQVTLNVNRFADLNGDNTVNVTDLLILFSAWGVCPGDSACDADLNGDGVVDVGDLLLLLSNWG